MTSRDQRIPTQHAGLHRCLCVSVKQTDGLKWVIDGIDSVGVITMNFYVKHIDRFTFLLYLKYSDSVDCPHRVYQNRSSLVI